MKASNVSQKVNETTYSSEFERIFGTWKPSNIGSYIWDPIKQEMVQISGRKILKNSIDPVVENVRNIDPVVLKRRENVTGTPD